jgi:uncharacterized protein
MEKTTQLNRLITTESENCYYLSRTKPHLLPMHPVLGFLTQLKINGTLESFLETCEDNNTEELELESGLFSTREEISYYCQYLQFLDDNQFFTGIEKVPMTEKRYYPQDIERAIANCQQIVLEVTELCNLKCKYCGYGELYTESDKRRNKDLDIDISKKLLDYLCHRFESPLNRRFYKKIALSFYGGEPLLKMPFIQEMVQYAESKQLTQNRFFYTMTTNGTLLDKHMDFLVSNNFQILVSLDGDKENNSYRVLPNNSSTYEVVYRNIRKIMRKYPEYYDRSINFISVIHDRNSREELLEFFQNQFNKTPILNEVNSLGIKPEKRTEFLNIYKNTYSDLFPTNKIDIPIEKEKLLTSPLTQPLKSLIKKYSGFVFNRYSDLLTKRTRPWVVCTGTCHPLERKLFLSAQGKILPCERISRLHCLGTIDQEGIHLDAQKIARQYNRYYESFSKMCNKCENSDTCSHCIFFLDMDRDPPACRNFQKANQVKDDISQQLSILEEIPHFYTDIMNNERGW